MSREGFARISLAAVLGTWPLASREALPPLRTLNPDFQAPVPGELLPLRPSILMGTGDKAGEESVSLRLWGKDILEDPDGWAMGPGAVEGPDLLLLADHIRYRAATGEIEAEGHIRMEAPGLRLRCQRLRMDWKRKVGEAWALDMDLPPTWHLHSEKVAFNTLKHWDFEKVELSPCPQEQPGWKAQVSRLTADLDHFATIRNLWIWVGDVPTFYFLPWAMYPAKAERTSGLLPITLVFSSPMGASVQLPYYQVLGDTADMTVSPQFFTKQSVLWASEARWNPEPTHQGSFSGEFINQRITETVTSTAADGTPTTTSQDGHTHRYRFTFKELWQREDGWQLAADLNRASDALLDADFGQGIARMGATPFDSAVYLGKNLKWASFSVAASEQRTFFPADARDPGYNPYFPSSLRRQALPTFQATLYPVPLGSFYVDGGARLGRMAYKLDLAPEAKDSLAGDAYGWNRDDAFLRVQGRLGQWGPLRADLETLGRYSRYSRSLSTSLFNLANVDGDNLRITTSPFVVDAPGQDRLLGSARLQLSAPPLGRTFPEVHLLGYSGEIKHVMNPYFAFTTTSRASAEGSLPHFDEVDSQPGVAGSATGERSLELGVKQHILGRPGQAGAYLDLVRWKASTKFHTEPILLNDGRVLRGWGTLDNDIDVEPNETLRISFHRSTNISDADADQSLSTDYKAGDGTRFSLAYFSTGINRLLVRQKGIQFGGLQRLWNDHVRLEFQANYDFRNHAFANSQVALAYITPCVAYSLRFSHVGLVVTGSVARENRLDLVMTLRGLGDLGKFGF